jgi:hypothetical protein
MKVAHINNNKLLVTYSAHKYTQQTIIKKQFHDTYFNLGIHKHQHRYNSFKYPVMFLYNFF